MEGLATLIAAHPIWAWLAVGAVFLAMEVVTGSGWLLWPAGSAAITGLLTLVLPMSAPAAIAVFGALTIVTTYLGRRFLRPPPSTAADPNNPLTRLVGHRGEATAAFEGGDGRVFVDGKEWSAVLEGDGSLEKGSKVEVVEVLTGARLRVRAAA